jgi:hypothetical protein
LNVRTPRRIDALPAGVRRVAHESADAALEIVFEGTAGEYIRRDVSIPLQ